MKKIITFIIAMACMLCTVIAQEQTSKVMYQENTFEIASILKNGTNYMKARQIADIVGLEVEYFETEHAVSFSNIAEKVYIDLKTGKASNATWNLGEVPVIVENGTTYLPLRFILEAFEYGVGYKDGTVLITSIEENSSYNRELLSSKWAEYLYVTSEVISMVEHGNEENGNLRDILTRMENYIIEKQPLFKETEYELRAQECRDMLDELIKHWDSNRTLLTSDQMERYDEIYFEIRNEMFDLGFTIEDVYTKIIAREIRTMLWDIE